MKLRRYEILLPLLYNDGAKIEKEKFLITNEDLLNKFGATTTDTTMIVGRWLFQNQLFEDKLMRIIIDAPADGDHEDFLKQYKEVLKERFKQIDIWITSYEINVV